MAVETKPQGYPVLSIVLTFRNEEEVLPELLRRLHAVLNQLGLAYEVIFVNDASTDKSLNILKEKAEIDRRIKVLNMARRFGVSECLVAGMSYASGEAILTMDTDLQDPPEIIPLLIMKWTQGVEIVYTVRKSRAGEPWLRQFLTRLAYHILRLASRDVDLPIESGDFRLLSRRACKELLKNIDRDPYLRGLVRKLKFSQGPVYYDREKRFSGKTHFPLFSSGPVKTFLAGLLSFSFLPLHFSFFVTAMVIFFGFSGVLFVFYSSARGGFSSEYFSAIWLQYVAVFFQLLSLGIMGLYAARSHRQKQKDPRYLLESTLNFEDLHPFDQSFLRR